MRIHSRAQNADGALTTYPYDSGLEADDGELGERGSATIVANPRNRAAAEE